MTDAAARAVLQRFGQFADAFAGCFTRHPQRDAASQYLAALFNDSERKSMQALHGRLSDPVSYQALQHFITDSPWEARALWIRLRALIRFWVREIMAVLYVIGNRKLLNLLVSFQRNPPLRI